ncbi:MAG TPA: DMP19 family protein [Pyrinomonadaceae bacterium]|nr:DMP19 family protein [Pyrinomonadaceae bacterium]
MPQIRFEIGDREIDGDDYFAVIEPVFWSVSIYDGPERYEQDLARFSNEQRQLLACHWYGSEVNNGGHNQFYFNSTGIVWPDALKGFVAMSLREVAAVVEESARRLGGYPSLDREEREQQLEDFNPDFEDLDNELFRLQEEIDFDVRAMQFIQTNREKFFFSGMVEKS